MDAQPDSQPRGSRKIFKTSAINEQSSDPRVINVDKQASYHPAFKFMKEEGLISHIVELRQIKYLNNIIDQDHRFTKRRMGYSQWFQTFETAQATISGDESIHMIRKGQIKGIEMGDFVSQKKFIENLFGLVA